jgi:3'-phosphoadenosine 5'-phosphosulfate sulfotransferase (PAPS reductase)/FAD synthetase
MLGQIKLSTDGELLDKVELAIKRLKAFEPPEGYYVAFSGGKDSQCIYHLCQMAGVKFDAHYNVTSVDPPELVKFIKTHYPDVKFEHQHDKNGKPITMWSLIPEQRMPPTRLARYCCAKLKETNGKGRYTVTGVRASESVSRKANQGVITVPFSDDELRETLEDMNVNFTQTPRGGGTKLRQFRKCKHDKALHPYRESPCESNHRLGRRGCMGVLEQQWYRALLSV